MALRARPAANSGPKNAPRAQSGGTARSLVPADGISSWSQPHYVAPTLSYRASLTTSATPQGWFGPGTAVAPSAPPEVTGRRFDMQVGYNQQQRVRPMEISYEQLRGFADAYDLVRIILEVQKDKVSSMPWAFVPRDSKAANVKELLIRGKEYEKMFRRPDREKFWATWIRDILEDLLVIDAPTIHLRRTVGGEIYSFDQIDGATIKPVLDDWGRTPAPPEPAYQQFLGGSGYGTGLPAVDYVKPSLDEAQRGGMGELLWMPRNKRVHKVYGFSPIEQIIMTINIGLRREIWQLQYFTEGNIPAALVSAPETWTPDQISAFQADFDALLEGNTAARRKLKFVPAGTVYNPTQEAEVFGTGEEWLIRVICACLGVSPHAFVKGMNRADSEQHGEESKEDGTGPLLKWVKGLMDTILLDVLGEEELEWAVQEVKEVDPKVQSEIVVAESSKGVISIDEAREAKGMEPLGGVFSKPMVLTATGYVPVDPDEQIALAKKKMDALGPTIGPDGQPLPPGQGDGGDKPGGGSPFGKKPGDKNADTPPASGKKPAVGGKGSAGAARGGGGDGAEKLQSSPLSLAKGADDQERDEHGRFAGSGGVDGVAVSTDEDYRGQVESDGSYGGLSEQDWSDWTADSELIQEAGQGTLSAGAISGYDGHELTEEEVSNYTRIAEQLQASATTNGVANTLFRGVSFDSEEDLKAAFSRNSTYQTGDLTSTSTDQEAARAYAEGGERSVQAILEFSSSTGIQAGIQTVSMGVPSNEVVVPKGAIYRVASVKMGADGQYHVSLYSRANTRDLNAVNASSPVGKLAKVARRLPHPLSVDSKKIQSFSRQMTKAVAAALAHVGRHVADQVDTRVAHVMKSDGPSPIDPDSIMADLDLDLDVIMDAVVDPLTGVAQASGKQALAAVGAPTDMGLVNQVNDRAVSWAQGRSAELIGKRVMPDGTIIDNPSAKWAIDQSTRDSIRDTIAEVLDENLGRDELRKRLEEDYAFSETRAEMITRTEIRRANSEAALDSYRVARDEAGLTVLKAWETAGDEAVDEDICAVNEAQGPIPLDDAFESGDDAPPGHPNCRCALTPVVEDPDAQAGGGDDVADEGEAEE